MTISREVRRPAASVKGSAQKLTPYPYLSLISCTPYDLAGSGELLCYQKMLPHCCT